MWRTDYCQIRFVVFIHSDFYLPVSVSIHDENRSTAIPKDLNVLYWKYISHWISVSIRLKSKHIRCQEKYTIVSWSRLSYEKCPCTKDTCNYLFESRIEDTCWGPPLLESKIWKLWWDLAENGQSKTHQSESEWQGSLFV